MKDIHEWLVEIGVRAPQPDRRRRRRSPTTNPATCATARRSPRSRARCCSAIPNLNLVELPESNWCCGSAGIYNIIQPEMANQLLDESLITSGPPAPPSWPPAIPAACCS